MTKRVPVSLWLLVALVGFTSVSHAEETEGGRKKSATPTAFGSLTGRIVIAGERPEQERLAIPATQKDLDDNEYKLDSFEHYRSLGLKDESLLVSPDGGLKNVVVWISDKKVPIPPTPPVRRLPAPASLKFENGLFQPRMLAFEAWRTLEIVNADKYATNTHWLSLGDEGFNDLLEVKASRQFQLQAQALPTRVRSDIYPWAQAWLFPVAHPYFAVTHADGKFHIDRLPLGDWEFRAWHEKFGYLKTKEWPNGPFTQKIEAGRTDLGTIRFELPPTEKPQPAEAARLEDLRKTRIKHNEKGNASEFAGTWKMKLPAGFEYDVKLNQCDNGLLELTSTHGALLLLGDFACIGSELRLVKPRHERIDDYIWEYQDGRFVLTRDEQAHGGNYRLATLTRVQ